MTWRDFIFRAIRVPFLQDGRDYDGWDCYGLVVCGYRDVLKIDVPSYSCEVYDHLRLARTFQRAMLDWPTVEPDVGAVAVIERIDPEQRPRHSRPIHCGLVMYNGMILHCEADVGTVQQPINSLTIGSFHGPPAG